MQKKSKAKAAPRARNPWPAGKTSKEDVSRALSKASFLANHAQANLGDSMESRLNTLYLGGGSDFFDGNFGYNGEFLQQSVFDGEESGQRGAPALSPLSRAGLTGQQDETKVAWLKMRLTNNIYDNDGQVASIIDLMADFATEGIKFVHHDDTVQKFYDSWSQKVNLKSRFRNAIIQLLVSGNVFFYRVFAKLSTEEERAMKTFTIGRTVGKKFAITDNEGNETLVDPKIEFDSGIRFVMEAGLNKKEFQEDAIKEQIKQFVIAKIADKGAKIIDTEIKPGAENVVPWQYVMLSPLQIVPEGDGWLYLLRRDDVLKLLNTANITYDDIKGAIKVTLPGNITGTLKTTKYPGFYAEMELSPDRLVVLQYNKMDWKKWATGLVWKAMPTITFKNTLRQMEIKTAKAAINTVVLWKLGDHKEGLMPILEDYERLADMLKAPASTVNVIWNSAIDVDVIQPKISEIFDVKRWEELRKEVTAQFGITQSVVTGEGGNFSSSFISVQGLLEKLETLRDILIESWIMEEVFIINKALKFRKLPMVRFNEMSLRDETAANNFAMGLYDRGLISDQTLYDTLEKDPEIERERLLNEKKWEDENKFDRRGPFIKVPEQAQHDGKMLDFQKTQHTDQMDLEKKAQQKDHLLKKQQIHEDTKVSKFAIKQGFPPTSHQPKQPGGPGGKPAGPTGPQKNKRPSKPKNAASRAEVEDIIERLDENCKKHLVTKAGVTDYRSLSKEDKEQLINLVGAGLAELDNVGATKLVDDNYPNIIDMNNYINTDFSAMFAQKVAGFNEENKRKPTKSEIYKLFVDSYMDI